VLPLHLSRGACHCIFVYDIAFAIDLIEAEHRVTSSTHREPIKHRRRAPRYFEYHSPPLRIIQDAGSTPIVDDFRADGQVELVVYDFGAVSVIYRVPLHGSVSRLLALSETLYENEPLLGDSRRRVEELVRLIKPALSRSHISGFVEDYFVFQIEAFTTPVSIQELTTQHALELAQILRAEARELSDDEVTDALAQRISFGRDDVAIVDWNAALVVDPEAAEDILTVLEFANVELLEMRFLDQRLDEALTRAYERLSKQPWKRFPFGSDPRDLRLISQWQVDSAILFEGVNNVLKLLGDQYLARLYRLIGQRFHLTDWDASILRKLETLQSIYQKISDQVAGQRMEVLEWIIILLIALSILLPFISSFYG
jgi:hypothetical protein